MRVGIVTAWGESGAGYVSRAYEVALAAQHAVFIMARGSEAARHDATWNGPNVTWATPHSALTGVYTGELRAWIRTHRLDAIVFNEQRHWRAVVDARRAGVLVGAYVDYYRVDTIPLFELYDFLLCNTVRHYQVFSWHSGAHYIPWGTMCDQFRPRGPAARPLTFFHSAGASGPNDRKGTGTLLAAFNQIHGDARLVVHSQMPLAGRPEKWRRLVYGNPRVEFVTATVGPPGLYHRGDVYVYPCKLDGIGLSVPEAMACGLSPIVPDAAPWTEFVPPETGFLVPTARTNARQDGYYWPEIEVSEKALVKAMQDCVDEPDQAIDRGRRAHHYANAKLDWMKNAASLPHLLETLTKKPAGCTDSDHLERAALQHDWTNNPSVWQRWASASLNVGRHLTRRLSR